MEKEREQMVQRQIEMRGIRNPALLAAMRAVPRERFVSAKYRSLAYDDTPLPIPAGQTISQPYVVALMIQLLNLTPEDRVLEIGAGSGYATAILSRLVKEVYAVERHLELAKYARRNLAALGYDNVSIHHSDGTLGWPEHAPYDAIMVSASGPAVPSPLRQQLAVGGRLIMPCGPRPRTQRLIRLIRRSESDCVEEKLGHVRFVPLVGQEGWLTEEEL